MNREIKFKIWDTQENKWYEPVYEAYAGKLDELFIQPSGSICRRFMDDYGKEHIEHESLFRDRYKKVQYSGLKDRHGKEIYESDIVRIGTDLRVVEWHIIGLRVKSIKHEWNFPLHYPFVKGGQTDWEIIGNIYENETLLNL